MQLMRRYYRAGPRSTRTLSFLLLLGSLAALLLVGERTIAALWQWYKFYGYSTPGIITLSLRMGLLFTTAAAALCFVALVIVRSRKSQAEDVGASIPKAAALLYGTSIVLYWLIALSPLNQWRP